MDDPRREPLSRHDYHSRRRSWCCSFAVPPQSPETLTFSRAKRTPTTLHKSETLSKSANSFPNSPQSGKSELGFSRMDPRRILSPGRASPINPDHAFDSVPERIPKPSRNVPSNAQLLPESSENLSPNTTAATESAFTASSSSRSGNGEGFDVRLNLKGKNGGCLVLELNSDFLSANGTVFANLISDSRMGKFLHSSA